MKDIPVAVVILAAGKGERMRSSRPKVLHEIGGLAMLGHVIATAKALAPARMALVNGAQTPEVADFVKAREPSVALAVQPAPQGTAHAVAQAAPLLEGFNGAVLILYADTPLAPAATLRALCAEIGKGASVAVLGFSPDDPGAYGRIMRDSSGALEAIVEAKDATAQERAIGFCNSGVMAIDAAFLRRRLADIGNDNAKGEYYLTDIVALARADGKSCAVIEAGAEDVSGVNSRAELAAAETAFQRRCRAKAMKGGATLIDPETVYFSFDTSIGKDVTIEPHVFFGPGVSVGDNVRIRAFSHIEGASIAAGAVIGPFARLRPGATIGPHAHVGNFVEVKNATLGENAKANHLSYLGDAEIGAGANIGAGTITCNYDGYGKHKTRIGKNAFIGSNSALVAPVSVGDGAYVGSGSVIVEDVEADDLALGRARQTAIKGWAARFRKSREKKT
jgi:bifunctional UDP-N-acetylglucosamine pyrophosphorylase/glucosamine-1-phosphate N-acetyltransferase